MFDWIHQLPLWTAKLGAGTFFGLVILFSWTIPRDFIYHDAPDRARWRDIRIWASALLLFQCVIYYFF